MDKNYDFKEFCEIISVLLGEGGCPWDRAQTHESLLPHLLEESYEVVDAVKNEDVSGLREELGDVLLQVVMHSKMAERDGLFSIDSVIDEISKKMINRHRHIFGGDVAASAGDVLDNWDKIKKEEKGHKSTLDVLESIPKALPALMRSAKVVDAVKKGKISVDSVENYINKAKQCLTDIEKLENADIVEKNTDEIEETLGFLLLQIVIISRFLQINPEFSLTNALEKFINRVGSIEDAYLSL